MRIFDTQIHMPLEVQDAGSFSERYILAFLHHPNPAIRTSIILGIVSVGTGIAGLLRQQAEVGQRTGVASFLERDWAACITPLRSSCVIIEDEHIGEQIGRSPG
jgi:hypothetical protein